MDRIDLEQWRPREVARLLALVEAQRRYFQEIIATIPIGLLVLSADLDIILANAGARRILNLLGAPAGLNVGTVLPAWVLGSVRRVLETGQPQTNLLVEGGTDAKRRLRIGIVAIQAWDDASAQEVLVTVEDLSGGGAEGRAQSLPGGGAGAVPVPTSMAQGLPAGVMESVAGVIWAVELPAMNFAFVSQAAEKLLGFPAEFWMNNPSFWADRVHPEDRQRVVQFYQSAIDRPEGAACEFRTVTAEGRVIWLRETAGRVADSAGRRIYLAGISVDVTERRMLEQQLVQGERVEAVQKLASRMAHDLNNMLMILQGNAEELLGGLPADSALRGEVQAILTATERITGLTGHLLTFTRKQVTAAETIELEGVLSAAIPRLGVERLGTLSRSRVQANAAHLEQVLAAVVEFARKDFRPEGRITVETSTLEIREEVGRADASIRRGVYAVIAIAASNGKETRDLGARPFERFLPEKDAPDDAAARLARAYAMVRQWGGDIAVSTGAAEGTLFRIFLERAPGPAEEPGPQVASAVPPIAPAGVETILVVEDEAGIRALVRKFLLKHGYRVLEASNGEEALAIVREYRGPIDLLITDMVMPLMGGRELADHLHEQGRELKILYISGYTDDSTVYAAELPPGNGFLQKPFTLSSLLEKVRQILSF